MHTKESITKQFIEAKNFNGEIPSRRWWIANSKIHGWAGASTVKRHFGTWNNAIEEVFGTIQNDVGEPSIEMICDWCHDKFMRKPSQAKRSRFHFCSSHCFGKHHNNR